MGLFTKAASALTGSTKKLDGRLDLLEAVCAGAARVMYADGDASDKEIDATKKAILSNRRIAEAFDSRTIDKTIDKMLDTAAGGRVGRAALMKEITESGSRNSAEENETILLTVLDIAESDGDISEAEMKVAEQIATSLGLKLSSYM